MSRIAYVNGAYVPHRDAAVHVEDRGYQFADGVYEVVTVWNGQPVDFQAHYQRLADGLEALEIKAPVGRAALVVILKQMIRRNLIRNGMLYFQISRGVSPRNHPFPKDTLASLVVTARPNHGPSQAALEKGSKVITVEDIRWKRRDIKSISLLPNVLAKQKAVEAGAAEAMMISTDGTVTEGSSSNMWIVHQDGTIVTRPKGPDILPGTVRARLIALARTAGYKVEERAFTVDEAKAAREVFFSSSTSYAMPVVQLDETVIGNGAPGLVAGALYTLYRAHMDGIDPATAWDIE